LWKGSGRYGWIGYYYIVIVVDSVGGEECRNDVALQKATETAVGKYNSGFFIFPGWKKAGGMAPSLLDCFWYYYILQ